MYERLHRTKLNVIVICDFESTGISWNGWFPGNDNIRNTFLSLSLSLSLSFYKFTLEQATKAQRGSRCIDLLFLKP